MHLEEGTVPTAYTRYIGVKIGLILLGVVLLAALVVVAVSVGAVRIPPVEVLQTLLMQHVSRRLDVIVFNIRLPQVLTAVVAGAGLAAAGAVMQSVLGNPLGSPFTLGISQAAAFGAAFSVMVIGSGVMHSPGADAVTVVRPGMTTLAAFAMSMVATAVVILVARLRRGSPEVMILAGVALGSLFTAGTMFLQYFADDVQLAAMVFWTFGDVARADWGELAVIAAVTGAVTLYFVANAWNYNAIDAGDETAQGLGVHVRRVRLLGMLFASMVTAVVIAFVGIIGFVGLVCPHMVRRLIGDDNRFLLPGSCVMGGLLLLAADTTARLVMAPHVLPVAVLTSFVGAPVFLYLIVKGYRR
ncbi:MAG: iron ABC transporter permease [Synergistales bacterium]|nr:iron ABC transporter permease [Synergistales bacterium]